MWNANITHLPRNQILMYNYHAFKVSIYLNKCNLGFNASKHFHSRSIEENKKNS